MLAACTLAACGGDDESTAQEAPPPAALPPPPGPPPNGKPTVTGSPPSQVLIDASYDFKPTASDPDGDILTFSIKNAPPWASFDPQTGRLFGVPEEGDLGAYAGIEITVTDGADSATLPAFDIAVVGAATGTATLTWIAPAQNTDGSPASLGGFKIYWGTESRDYGHSIDVGQNITTYVIDNLTPATWYFAVTAVDVAGLESDYSNEATKDVM